LAWPFVHDYLPTHVILTALHLFSIGCLLHANSANPTFETSTGEMTLDFVGSEEVKYQLDSSRPKRR
jgi:hypothetical protein